VLDAHFPESIRQDVLDAVGLSLEPSNTAAGEAATRRRDPAFRDKVLLAYEYRCCVCGHDLRLKQQIIALEAAHIKWFQAGGPDVEQNGLALCSLHHKVFDLGAFTIRPTDYVMLFSQHLFGNPPLTWLERSSPMFGVAPVGRARISAVPSSFHNPSVAKCQNG